MTSEEMRLDDLLVGCHVKVDGHTIDVSSLTGRTAALHAMRLHALRAVGVWRGETPTDMALQDRGP